MIVSCPRCTLASRSKPDPLGTLGGCGAFAWYARTFADLVWEIHKGTLSFERAAATTSLFISLHRSSSFLTQGPEMTTNLNVAFQALCGAEELESTQRSNHAPSRGTENTRGFHLQREFWSRSTRDSTRQFFFDFEVVTSAPPTQPRVENRWSGCDL